MKYFIHILEIQQVIKCIIYYNLTVTGSNTKTISFGCRTETPTKITNLTYIIILKCIANICVIALVTLIYSQHFPPSNYSSLNQTFYRNKSNVQELKSEQLTCDT